MVIATHGRSPRTPSSWSRSTTSRLRGRPAPYPSGPDALGAAHRRRRRRVRRRGPRRLGPLRAPPAGGRPDGGARRGHHTTRPRYAHRVGVLPGPHRPMAQLAHILGPSGRVRVVAPDVGGAFGSKGVIAPEVAAVAAAAIRLRARSSGPRTGWRTSSAPIRGGASRVIWRWRSPPTGGCSGCALGCGPTSADTC